MAKDGIVIKNVWKIFRRLPAFFTNLNTLPILNARRTVAYDPIERLVEYWSMMAAKVPITIIKSNRFQFDLK